MNSAGPWKWSPAGTTARRSMSASLRPPTYSGPLSSAINLGQFGGQGGQMGMGGGFQGGGFNPNFANNPGNNTIQLPPMQQMGQQQTLMNMNTQIANGQLTQQA